MTGHPPPDTPPFGTNQLLLVSIFDAGRFTEVRHAVDAVIRRCRLSAEKAADFVTAVNEVMINAVRHGGGSGELRLWESAQLVCEVRDRGPGFPAAGYLNRSQRPTPSPDGGMGLWIVQQTTDTLSIDSGPAGTTVRIGAALAPRTS
ncbi:ATP-binding protein [Micromonospora sp. NBC_01699]|uniref:ATP-binding protein n=1 Tax=Micromonospora sp. NBC_01699 TaxID=2975984 RepID=UPI002E2F0E29|nr:ATP-binding protein [Micromonospora sp. NBC_01699]